MLYPQHHVTARATQGRLGPNPIKLVRGKIALINSSQRTCVAGLNTQQRWPPVLREPKLAKALFVETLCRINHHTDLNAVLRRTSINEMHPVWRRMSI